MERLQSSAENNLTPLVNIDLSHDLTIKELAETVKTTIGYTVEITFDTTKPDGTPRKLMDVSRLNSMGWQATTRFEDRQCLERSKSSLQVLADKPNSSELT